MIRLVFVIAVIAQGYILLTNQQGAPAKPEEVYQRQVDEVDALEQQLQDQAQRQLDKIDATAGEP